MKTYVDDGQVKSNDVKAPSQQQRTNAPVQHRQGLDAANVSMMQGTVGNRAIGRLLDSAEPLQRLELKNDMLVSSFDSSKVISGDQAVITARSEDGFTGGHAVIYLEYLNANGEGEMWCIDLVIYTDTGKIDIRQGRVHHEYNPSNILTKKLYEREIVDDNPRLLRKSGQYQSYAIGREGVPRALKVANGIQAQADKGALKYLYSGSKVWNLNPFASTTAINCADFAAQVMKASGVSVASSGLLSMPSAVAGEDNRDEDAIYAGTDRFPDDQGN